MSSFLSTSFDENNLSNSNVPSEFASPKAPEKDFSLVIPRGLDSSIRLSSPINYPHSEDQNVSVIDLCSEEGEHNVSAATADETAVAPGGVEETLEERLAREERESQELAWQLMQQENMEMYNLQLQYMQQSADHIDDDDLQLIRALMNEAGQQVVIPGPAADEERDEEDEEEDSDVSNWDYDRLLQLGHQIGDVKTERWRMKSKSVIASLPRRMYKDIVAAKRSGKPEGSAAPATVFKVSGSSNDTAEAFLSPKKQCIRDAATGVCEMHEHEAERCVVCMDDYQLDEELIVFPCKHYFHIPCTEGWLADHNCCPSCKQKVVASPEK